MPITEAYHTSATIGTAEYSLPNNSTTLTPITTDGIYQAFIDLAAMLAGDQYRFTLYEKVNAGTQRAITVSDLVGVQAGPFVTPALILIDGWDMTLKKIAGTDRSILWSIRQVA